MLIIDGHCDTLSRCRVTGQALSQNNLHWDINRARSAGIRIQFMALYNNLPEYDKALAVTMEQITLLYSAADKGELHVVTCREDLKENDTLGAVMHMEGGGAIGDNPDLLLTLYQLGLRSLGLTWNHRNQLADGVGVANPEGISPMGKAVLKRAGQLGIIIDLAHLAAPGVDYILDNYPGTVVYSHGNYQEVHQHPRNITHSQAQRLAQRGGVIGLSLYPPFIAEKATVDDWVKHAARLCDDIGCEYVALGSDYDGDNDSLLGGDVTFYQQLPQILSKYGFLAHEIDMITSGNWLRILNKVLP